MDTPIAPPPSPSNPQDFALEHFLPYRLSLLSNTVSEGIALAYRTAFGFIAVMAFLSVALYLRTEDRPPR